VGLCGHCQYRELFVCLDGPVLAYARVSDLLGTRDCEMAGDDMAGQDQKRPKLAVWKFASCDGCQLTLLNCEDELIPLAGAVEIAYFPEATRAVVGGSLRRIAGRRLGDYAQRCRTQSARCAASPAG